MENEMQEGPAVTLEQVVLRLAAAVESLERVLPRVAAASETVGPIVAMIEGGQDSELLQRLAAAEKTIAELRASASVAPVSQDGRRTLPVSLLAKQEGGLADTAALDAALGSLSLEQRITVKSQLLRAGLV